MGLDRWLARVGADPAASLDAKLDVFRRLFLLVVAVEAWNLWPGWDAPRSGPEALRAVALTACAGLAWLGRGRRAAPAAAALLVLAELVATFPEAGNHQYLQVLCGLLLALPDERRDAEKQLVLQALRWLVVIGLVSAGLQKALHGYYFQGEYLAYAAARNERFAAIFGPLIPAHELARLRGLGLAAGAGPYRLDAPAFVLVSNLTWLGEIALPLALLVRRLRPLALVACLAYVAAIELGAREIFFGGLMLNLLLLYTPGDSNRRALPLFLAFYLYALAMVAGLLPRWTFS